MPPICPGWGRDVSGSRSFHQSSWRRDRYPSTQATQAPAPGPELGRVHVTQLSEAASSAPESCVCADHTPLLRPPGTFLSPRPRAAGDGGHSQTLGAQRSPDMGHGTWDTVGHTSPVAPTPRTLRGGDWRGREMGSFTIPALGAPHLG